MALVFITIQFISTSYLKKERVLISPTNTTKIGVNLFVDETEVTNLSWLFYVLYQKTIYGDTVLDAILPDTALWHNEDSSLHSLSRYYYQHPSYQNYPVVGINQKQALAYCKWRTERILEYSLLRESITYRSINYQSRKKFTLSIFLSDSFSKIREETHIKQIAIFSLPSVPNYKKALHYNDSVNYKYFNSGFRKYFDTCQNVYPTPFVKGSAIRYPNSFCPLSNVNYEACTSPYKGLMHLRGNASEWISEKGMAIGGNFKSTRDQVLKNPVFYQNEAAVHVGVRCIAKYVTISELLN